MDNSRLLLEKQKPNSKEHVRKTKTKLKTLLGTMEVTMDAKQDLHTATT